MDVTGVSPTSGVAGTPGARSSASSYPSFSSTLATQQQLDAARDVLATLPPPMVYAMRDYAGSPTETVDNLFIGFRDGAFELPKNEYGAPGTIMHATAHAATVFDTPDQMWVALRTAIFDPSSVASMFLNTTPVQAASPMTYSAAAAPVPSVAPVPASVSEVRTLEDAARVVNSVRSAVGSSIRLDWWEAALRFLLEAQFPSS